MKRRFFLVPALILCLLLSACGKQPSGPAVPQDTPPAPEQPETPREPETPEQPQASQPRAVTPMERRSELRDPEDGSVVLITVTSSFPDIEGMDQVTGYYRTVQDDLEAVYSADLADAALMRADLLAAGGAFQPYTVEMDYQVLRNDGRALSLLRRVYENRGGAHPSVLYRAETFDAASQGRLLLGDLFSVGEEDYLPLLMDKVRAQLSASGEQSWYEGVEQRLESLYDPLDFALTGDSLLVFFNEGELAPHAAGAQMVYIPLSELGDSLQPRWVTP